MKKKVLFITRPFIIEPLGIAALSANLKKYGFDVDLIQIEDIKNIKTLDYHPSIKEIIEYNPDFLCYSLWTGGHKFFYEVNWYIRKAIEIEYPDKEIYSIFGGPHITFCSDNYDEYVDYIIKGEADYTLPILCINLSDGISVAREIKVGKPPQDLNVLPEVDRTILYKYPKNRKNPIRSIMSSRGCPYSCPFCFNERFKEIFEGKKLRFRDIGNVVMEAQRVKYDYPETRYFFFQDDELGCNVKRLKELANNWSLYVGLPFHAQLRVEYIKDERIGLLKEAGCNSITFSIESGNYKTRREILNKKFTNEQIFDAVRILKKHKMRFRIENMIGIPFIDVEADMWDTYQLNKRLKPTMGWASLFQPYPGTSLGDRCKRNGLYSGNTDEMPEAFFDRTILRYPEKMRRRLENMQKLFSLMVSYKVPKFVAEFLISR